MRRTPLLPTLLVTALLLPAVRAQEPASPATPAASAASANAPVDPIEARLRRTERLATAIPSSKLKFEDGVKSFANNPKLQQITCSSLAKVLASTIAEARADGAWLEQRRAELSPEQQSRLDTARSQLQGQTPELAGCPQA